MAGTGILHGNNPHWCVLVHTGVYWSVLVCVLVHTGVCTCSYWCVLVCTGVCTGPHWSVLARTGPHWCVYWSLLVHTIVYWSALLCVLVHTGLTSPTRRCLRLCLQDLQGGGAAPSGLPPPQPPGTPSPSPPQGPEGQERYTLPRSTTPCHAPHPGALSVPLRPLTLAPSRLLCVSPWLRPLHAHWRRARSLRIGWLGAGNVKPRPPTEGGGVRAEGSALL